MNNSAGLDLVIDLRPETEVALHRQIYEQIRAAILTGRVRSHQKLPASRQLATSLSVSRTTVTQSYDQLISEGYLHTKPGAGTFVCAQIPDSLLRAASISAGSVANNTAPKRQAASNQSPLELLSAYGDRLQQLPERTAEPDGLLSFRYWQPDTSLFPVEQWQRLVNRHRTVSTDWMGYSSDPLGYEPLRVEIANYIAQTRAVHCHPDQILITQGTQQALSLIARVLLEAGEAIALENPGYLSARKVFSSHGATLVPVPVDGEGIRVQAPDGLSKLSAHVRTKLVYVTPSHQFPTGVLMSLPRRLALLQWAHQTNALIIEDDYDSEFRYGGRPIPALQGLDTYQRVLYIGTFSKVMFPGLQLGYMVLPPSLVAVFAQAKWLCDRQTSLIHQAALTDFIAKGHLAKHIRRMRVVYAQRRETLVVALERAALEKATRSPSQSSPAESLKILGDPAGLHVMAKLPTAPKPDEQLVSQTRHQGVQLFSAQPYYLPSPQRPYLKAVNAFIFGFGGLNPAQITAAIAKIQPHL